MRSVLNKIQLSALALGLAVGGVVACGDDEPAPQGNNNPGPVGDGDGNTSGDGDQTGDGDGTGQEPLCQTDAAQACACDDGVTQGQQYCLGGAFAGACMGCPCTDGAQQVCQCDAGGIGSQTCSAGAFGECACTDADPDAECPASTMCAHLGGMDTLPAMCLAAGGFLPIPPECTTNDDCATQGFANPTCLDNPIALPPLVPAKICIQTCVIPTTPAP